MRLLSICFLTCLLGCVYWLGATSYSRNIEKDITDRSGAAVAKYNPSAAVDVDGRDVTVTAFVDSPQAKSDLIDVADVWGTRRTRSNIVVAAKEVAPAPAPIPAPAPTTTLPPFDFNGHYDSGSLHISGLVDEDDVLTKLDEIPAALPPSTVITVGTLVKGAADLVQGPGKVETGIAALTQLNNGTLKITDKDFILTGTVSDQDRLDAINRLLATRADVLAPLNVIPRITIDSYLQVTAACRSAIANTMQNNVVNYKVNFYEVENEFAGKLNRIADLVNGVCAGQISQVLVEGHADFTGGAGYNQGLSERRASAAQNYLQQQGVSTQHIAAFGYGEFRPISSNESSYGRSQNRRTEIHLTTIPVGASNSTQISTIDE